MTFIEILGVRRDGQDAAHFAVYSITPFSRNIVNSRALVSHKGKVTSVTRRHSRTNKLRSEEQRECNGPEYTHDRHAYKLHIYKSSRRPPLIMVLFSFR
jgi:hypothetical protein